MKPVTHREYIVTPYNPDWHIQFMNEAGKLNKLLGELAFKIEHIGSTAIPGMEAKPILDILILVKDESAFDIVQPIMEKAGYIYEGQYVTDNSRLYRKLYKDTLLANIHVFPIKHPHVNEMLSLRDYLRSHPEEAKQYSEIKKELYNKYPTNYIDYRKNKDIYIKKLMSKVMVNK
jgi:GrpB-like predicted nucleotidyltransferase (UPF0157 family)